MLMMVMYDVVDDDGDDDCDDVEVNLQMLGISLIAAKGRAWLVSMWLQQPNTNNTAQHKQPNTNNTIPRPIALVQ